MKYSHQIQINLARPRVVELITDPENFREWQGGLVKYRTLSGQPGEKGYEAELTFEQRGRPIEMRQRVVESNLPSRILYNFETQGVLNIQENLFEENEHGTLWTSINEFRFAGFLMKSIGFIMPGAFKKQSYKFMQDFAAFAENRQNQE